MDDFARRCKTGELSITTMPDGSGVLLDLAHEVLLNFNATGAFMLACLTEGMDEARVVTRVLERYDVDQDTAHADVAQFVDQLARAIS
jgi:hypothetical protein